MIIIKLPIAMAQRRPRLSVTKGTIGSTTVAPREYMEVISPSVVDLGE